MIRYRIAAHDEDWPAIHRLVAEAFAFMEGRIDPPSSLRRWTAATFRDAAAAGPAFLAVEDGRVVGCAFGEARPDDLHLSKIAVAPRRRGAGVGRALIDLAAWAAAQRGLAMLTLQSRIELTETHAAFAALGFRRTGETAHPGFARPTSLSFRRPVGAPPAPGFLVHAGAAPAAQREALLEVTAASPALSEAFARAAALDLPGWRIVSGALYNQVWNHLTGREDMRGVKDIDLFYHDPDTSWEAEDAVIRRAAAAFADWSGPPVEVRNQARVHLWYADHFGETGGADDAAAAPYAPLASAEEGIDRFACRTHCLGLRRDAAGRFDLYAPYGLDDVFGFRITPNTVRPNRATHEAKAARQGALWPELTVAPWPEAGP